MFVALIIEISLFSALRGLSFGILGEKIVRDMRR